MAALHAALAVVLARFGRFRDGLYAWMEGISFRTSVTVLGGVVMVAAVVAAVTVLLSQAPARSRTVALSPAPASHPAPPASAAPPPRPAPPSAVPARAQAPAVPDPARAGTYPATDEDSTPSPGGPAATSGRAAPVQRINSAVAAWAAWGRSRLSPAGGHRGILPSGFGGFGFGGHEAGHR